MFQRSCSEIRWVGDLRVFAQGNAHPLDAAVELRDANLLTNHSRGSTIGGTLR
jgi:hypothetical protein